jgi:hypothetical protein
MKLINILKEDFRYSKDKVKSEMEKYKRELEKYKSSSKLLYNKFSNFSIGDLLEESDFNQFKRISEAAEKFVNKLDAEHSKILDYADHMSEEYDETKDREAIDLYHELHDLASEYNKISDALGIMKDISDKLVRHIEHLMEYDKIEKLKDFREGIK